MRNRFEQQLAFGQLPISEIKLPVKSKSPVDELVAALKELYCNQEYNEKIFNLLEKYITSGKKKTGRKGMDLWCIFVLAQIRLCLNTSYDMVYNLANNHRTLRQVMGVERSFGYEPIEFEYQQIYDNVSLLSDELIAGLNEIILDFGHQVFKKKDDTALRLKTDSFVVESNVHFPTDYNLLWDCSRKCLDMIDKFLKKYNNVKGWRKIDNWRHQIKGLMRELGKASSSGGKGKQERMKNAASRYLVKAKTLYKKLQEQVPLLPIYDKMDVLYSTALEGYMVLLDKHIDLVDRRILKGEKIPHEEKLFSIFERYTEWVNKGKMHPNVELGKKLSITTDQYNLIVDYTIMNNQQDRDIVIELADRVLIKYQVASWSFDKGYWKRENKELLQLEVANVIMPKLGKRNKTEDAEEKSHTFKKLKNKHSTIESNINELENRGLDRCPDRGAKNYTKYIGLGVCAYNLKKIGRQILKLQREGLEKIPKLKTAA